MKFSGFFLLALFLTFLSPTFSFALDLYSFIDSSCEIQTGLIVGVNENSIEILNLSGKFALVPKKTLNTVVIFSTLQNPIPELKLEPSLLSLAKEVSVNEDDKPLFVGWPIRFIEDLVIFYDVSGKIHVLELSDITKIRNFKNPSSGTLKLVEHSPLTLSFNDVNSQCPSLNVVKKEGTGPTRIISDKISISEFLSNFESGFRKIDSYQERTLFYAKPFLYEKRSKLGVIVFNEFKENTPILPMYFQWSTGKPYGFQSFNVFGSAPAEWVPATEPVSGVRSDLKSHFFNASFVGNLVALPAGNSYFVGQGVKFPKDVQSVSLFNYMALLGADYGPYSFSFGTYFPLFGFHVKNLAGEETREVLASSVSPAFRIMFTKGRTHLHAVYSSTQADGIGSDEKLLRINSISTAPTANYTAPDHFYFWGSFLRAGFNYQLSDELKVGADEIYSLANYSELSGATKYWFNSTQLNTTAYLVQSFGYYISVKVYFNFFNRKYDYSFANGADKPSTQETSIGGAFEFVF